jgi:dihydrofolate synthase/folylpolyglutamate synthase
MPAAIAEEARRIGATLLRLGVDFDFVSQEDAWEWHGRIVLRGLPMPALPGTVQLDNAATVLTGLDCLSAQLPLSRISIERGLRTVALAGRFQAIPSQTLAPREWLLDVAHNPAAAAILAENLKARPCDGKTIAVCGMFADKDVAGVISAVAAQIDVWVVATANGARALPAEQMAERVSSCCGKAAAVAADVASACSYAQSIATAEDRIVAFGSFQTVGPALAWLGQVQVN